VTTREEALHIATEYLSRRSVGEYSRVGRVLAWDEIDFRRPSLYLTSPVSLQDVWICYLESDVPLMMLRSSEIIVVSSETGQVIYAGSASG
jgi:hypothetical protein